MCDKCNNTGTKVKNGLLCQDCWERFGPRNHGYVQPAPYLLGSGLSLFLFGGPNGGNYVPYGGGALHVNPGDPRIGGTLCGRCRGSGRVLFFLLDEDLCPQCHGVGRVFI